MLFKSMSLFPSSVPTLSLMKHQIGTFGTSEDSYVGLQLFSLFNFP